MALVLGIFVTGGRLAFGGEPVNVAKAVTAPAIDGELNDVAWRTANRATGLVTRNGEPAKVQTRIYFCYDNSNLYIAFDCDEPDTSALTKASTGEKDIWRSGDDVLAMVINPDDRLSAYYQFVTAPNGSRFDQKVMGERRLYGEYSPEWKVKTKISKSNWTAEIAIPFEAFGITEQMGSTWRMNLCRKRTQSNETSSWHVNHGNWHDLSRSACLQGFIIEQGEAGPPVYLKEISAIEDKAGPAVFKGTIKNRTKEAISGEAVLTITSPAGEVKTHASPFSIGRKERKDISLGYAISLQEGKHSLRLALRNPKTGDVYYTSPPASVYVSSFLDAYLSRNYYTRETEAKLIVQIKGLDKEALADMRLGAEVLDPGTGKVLLEGTADASIRNSIKLKIHGLGHGEYPVTVSLLNKEGKRLTSFRDTLRKLSPRNREVKIDRENRVVLLNNSPYFIRLITCVPHDQVKNAAKAGFNAVFQRPNLADFARRRGEYPELNVDAAIKELKAYLDEAQASNLNVILAITHGGGKGEHTPWDNNLVKPGGILEALIPQIREHPALLAYYSIGEPSITGDAAQKKEEQGVVKSLYDTLRRLDPYLPVIPVFMSRILYREGWDIASIDNYWKPRTGSPLSVVLNTVKAVAIAAEEHKPFIDVPCCARWSASERELLPAEHRAQTYLDIVHGAVGFQWYQYRPYTESLWEEMRKISLELKELSPVILTSSPDHQVISSNPAQPIHVLLKEYKDKVYLIGVNGQDREVQARFIFTDGLTTIAGVKVLFENRRLDSSQDGFSDSFAGYASHVYEIGGTRTGRRYVLRTDADIREEVKVALKRKNAPSETGKINLVPNSSAEATTNPDLPDYWIVKRWNWNWDKKLKLYVDGETSVDGYNSIRMQKGILCIPYVYQAKQFDPGQPHTFSLYMKADRENVAVRLMFGAQHPFKGIVEKRETVSIGKSWERYVFTKDFSDFEPNCDSSKPLAIIVLTLPEESEPAKIWIDAVQVEEGDRAHLYTEDAATRAYWEGRYPIPWRR